MDIRLAHRWLSQQEIEKHKDDPNFHVKEPGLLVQAVVPGQKRDRKSAEFIPQSVIKKMIRRGGRRSWLRRLFGL